MTTQQMPTGKLKDEAVRLEYRLKDAWGAANACGDFRRGKRLHRLVDKIEKRIVRRNHLHRLVLCLTGPMDYRVILRLPLY